MKERIIIVFIAIIIGLVLTTVGYLIYQSTQMQIPEDKTEQTSTKNAPTATPHPDNNSLFVELSEPKQESLTNKRTITIKGRTNPGNTVIISSNQDDVIADPLDDGSFSTTISINAGSNILVTRAIDKDGNSVEDKRVVTFVAEDF